jgi:hypothetical protein
VGVGGGTELGNDFTLASEAAGLLDLVEEDGEEVRR